MPKIHPFQNDSESASIGGLTIENGTDRLKLYGTIDLTRDKAGLADARELKTILDEVVSELEGEAELPDETAPPKVGKTIKNPFA